MWRVLLLGTILGLSGCSEVEVATGSQRSGGLVAVAHARSTPVKSKPANPNAPPTPIAVDDPAPPRCPDGMLLVEGRYCPSVEHECLRYLDPPGKFARCAEYARPARCTAKLLRPMRFCIDRDEYVARGSRVPLSHQSFVSAQRLCKLAGKRLCKESEWNFACEGETRRPYPYGFERDVHACNADHVGIATKSGKLADLRVAPGAYPSCVSPFGVHDMAGNVEELTARDDAPDRPALKGAHWLPGRNHCRAVQTVHGPTYSGVETGFRCCADL